jgi:hypothetical protein
MRSDERERAFYTDTLRYAAAVDRVAGHYAESPMSLKVSALRGRLEAVLEDLRDRYGFPERSRIDLFPERMRPWDKI